jgi:hypothetical protein
MKKIAFLFSLLMTTSMFAETVSGPDLVGKKKICIEVWGHEVVCVSVSSESELRDLPDHMFADAKLDLDKNLLMLSGLPRGLRGSLKVDETVINGWKIEDKEGKTLELLIIPGNYEAKRGRMSLMVKRLDMRG